MSGDNEVFDMINLSVELKYAKHAILAVYTLVQSNCITELIPSSWNYCSLVLVKIYQGGVALNSHRQLWVNRAGRLHGWRYLCFSGAENLPLIYFSYAQKGHKLNEAAISCLKMRNSYLSVDNFVNRYNQGHINRIWLICFVVKMCWFYWGVKAGCLIKFPFLYYYYYCE